VKIECLEEVAGRERIGEVDILAIDAYPSVDPSSFAW
jgi:hypothetical protein